MRRNKSPENESRNDPKAPNDSVSGGSLGLPLPYAMAYKPNVHPAGPSLFTKQCPSLTATNNSVTMTPARSTNIRYEYAHIPVSISYCSEFANFLTSPLRFLSKSTILKPIPMYNLSNVLPMHSRYRLPHIPSMLIIHITRSIPTTLKVPTTRTLSKLSTRMHHSPILPISHHPNVCLHPVQLSPQPQNFRSLRNFELPT